MVLYKIACDLLVYWRVARFFAQHDHVARNLRLQGVCQSLPRAWAEVTSFGICRTRIIGIHFPTRLGMSSTKNRRFITYTFYIQWSTVTDPKMSRFFSTELDGNLGFRFDSSVSFWGDFQVAAAGFPGKEVLFHFGCRFVRTKRVMPTNKPKTWNLKHFDYF